MKVLVTGAAGGIGRAVTSRLAAAGASVVALDRQQQHVESAVTGPAEITYVRGEATDEALVRTVIAGCDAVVHLAAIPHPDLAPPVPLFATNTVATMSVLTAAAEAGVRSAVLASSISVLGLVHARTMISPAYAPVDERHPLTVEDAYALSKQVDEATGSMISRKYGIPVAALRFPYTSSAEEIERRAAELNRDPSGAERELWAYLERSDAAEACAAAVERQLHGQLRGYECFNVAADDALVDVPLGELFEQHHPSTPLRVSAADFRCSYDLGKSSEQLGFHASYCRPRGAAVDADRHAGPDATGVS